MFFKLLLKNIKNVLRIYGLKQFGELVLVACMVTGNWFHSCGPVTAKTCHRPSWSVATRETQQSSPLAMHLTSLRETHKLSTLSSITHNIWPSRSVTLM